MAAQGPDTDPKAISIIRDAIKSQSEATVRILNYRKSGQPFWNMLTIAPMADVDGTSRFFIGVQVRGIWSSCLGPLILTSRTSMPSQACSVSNPTLGKGSETVKWG